jgi:hypothetical protein
MGSMGSIQKRYCIILLLAAVFLCFHSSVAKGEDTGKIAVNDTKSSVTFRIYKVATRTETGYEKEERFKDCVIDFEKQDGESLRNLGITLYDCVARDQILPDMEEMTDKDGDALFSGLEEGWYLLTSDSSTVPVIVEVAGGEPVEVIPKKQEPKGTNDTPVVVETKRSETETSVTVKKGNLPRTGQLWWPVILLAAGGILFVVWGLIIKRKRK